nr:unnamed protein product [Callosobruchus analis]
MEFAEDFGEIHSTIHPNTSSPSILWPSASRNTVSSETQSPISHSQRDAACNTEISQTTSIEQIILSRIQQKNVPSGLKRRKVASGAEVITSTEMIELLKLKEQTQSAKKVTKKKSTKKEADSKKTVNSGSEDEVPYADSDTSCCIEDEDLDEEYSSDTENKENIETPEMKDRKHTTRSVIEQEVTREQGAEQERAEREGMEEEAMKDSQEISVGKWVLVKYGMKKRVKFYVGIVQMQVDDRWEIRFARRRENTFVWPILEDIDHITADSIVQILPNPKINKRGIISFDFKFKNMAISQMTEILFFLKVYNTGCNYLNSLK